MFRALLENCVIGQSCHREGGERNKLSGVQLDNFKGEYCKDVKFRNVSTHFTIISLATFAALYQWMLIGETIKPYIPREVLQDFLRLKSLLLKQKN